MIADFIDLFRQIQEKIGPWGCATLTLAAIALLGSIGGLLR